MQSTSEGSAFYKQLEALIVNLGFVLQYQIVSSGHLDFFSVFSFSKARGLPHLQSSVYDDFWLFSTSETHLSSIIVFFQVKAFCYYCHSFSSYSILLICHLMRMS